MALTQTEQEVQDSLDWKISKDSDEGIRVDPSDPTFPWHDIIGQITPAPSNPSSPSIDAFKGNIEEYHFSNGDYSFITFHMPHDYKLGTDLFLHVHWGHNGTAISGTNVMISRFMYAPRTATPASVFGAENTLNISVPVDITNFPQYCHSVDEIQISQSGGGVNLLDSDDIMPDGLVLVEIEQSTLPTITGGTESEPFIFTADLHYQSTCIGTKNSAAPFYT